MTEIKAKLSRIRTAPRKTRLVANLIRNKNVREAERLLNFTYKKTAGPFLKLLKSAAANGKNNFSLPEENLYVKELRVDKGPTLKRHMPRARGRASRINKRTSHIIMILGEVQNQSKIKSQKPKIKIKE